MTHAHKRKGFTLIEILIAIVIVGIMMAVAVPASLGYIKSTRIARTKQDLRTFETSFLQYNSVTGRSPESLRDLVRPPVDDKLRKKWQEGGPFLKGKDIQEDPWGNPYVYRLTPGAEHPYELFSHGPNGPGSAEGRISVWEL